MHFHPSSSSIEIQRSVSQNLEKESYQKNEHVEQSGSSPSSILLIVDCYIGNQLGEAIQKAIQSHIVECREEYLAKKNEYIDLIDTLVRAIIKEEVNTQLPHILPQAVSDFGASYLPVGRDEKDNDQDLSAGSDRGTKRRSKQGRAYSYSKNLKSKESKSSSSSKGTSSSQHKSSGKSAQAEDPSHTIDDSE
ncbi:hypothetical protein Tco_0901925 [Tanacetum coccineum]